MRLFVTGASGWIGSAVVPQLIDAGHKVIGLARSESAAGAIAASGADVLRGDLTDFDSLRAGAEAADGVVHLGYIHDFAQFEQNAAVDRRALETFGDVLAGSDAPLVFASGALRPGTGSVLTETDTGDLSTLAGGRAQTEQFALGFAGRGLRPVSVRLAPTVHGTGDHGFMARIVQIARDSGVSGYLGDGSNRWPAVHRDDAARLICLAVDNAPAGTALHGVAEEGVRIRDVAEVIGRHLDVPVRAIDSEQAGDHFGFLAAFLGLDAPASNTLTRKQMSWEPAGPGLIEDLDQGHYFA